MSEEILGFDHVNLNEVDPTDGTLPTNVYTLQVLKGEMRTSQKGNPYVSLTLAVTDDPTYSGRRIFHNIFPGDMGFKDLRRLMDATGVVQTPGTELKEWLAELTTVKPTFKTTVLEKDDLDKERNPRSLDYKGNVAKVNRVTFRNAVPA